jgi:hypothetical protein
MEPGTSAHARHDREAVRAGILIESSDFPAGAFLVVQRIHLPLELRTSTAIRFAPSDTTIWAVRFEVLTEIEVSRQAGPGEAQTPDWHAIKATTNKVKKRLPTLGSPIRAANLIFMIY